MSEIPQEVLDLIIKELNADNDGSAAETLKNIRLTNKACSQTAARLLFSRTGVSICDLRTLPQLQRLSRSRFARLVRHITIFVDRPRQVGPAMPFMTCPLENHRPAHEYTQELKKAMSYFVNLESLRFTHFLHSPGPRGYYHPPAPRWHQPPWIAEEWRELLSGVVYPKLNTLMLDECTMLKRLSLDIQDLNLNPNVTVRPFTLLQHNMSCIRDLRISDWFTLEQYNVNLDDTLLCASTGILDRLELSNISNTHPGNVPRLLRGCQTKHLTIAKCDIGFSLFSQFLGREWTQMQTLSIHDVVLRSGSWLNIFQGIPLACPNLIDIEVKSVCNYRDMAEQLSCKRKICLEVLKGYMYAEDVAALVILLRTIGQRRQAVGLLDTDLEAYAKYLEGVKTWRCDEELGL